MTLLERIDAHTRLWKAILPEVPAPDAAWVSRWCSYPDSAIEQGIVRASKKFDPRCTGTLTVDPRLIYQFVCGVARNESRR